MPNTKQCEKRLRQDKKRAARNNFVRNTIKTLTKRFRTVQLSIEEKEALLSEIYSKLDKAAKRNVIHKRTASRRKARLSAHFAKEFGTQAVAE